MPRVSFREAKSAAWVGYEGRQGESWSFPDGSTWTVAQHWRTTITGFNACLLTSSRDVRLLTFGGTDGAADVASDIHQVLGGLPPQYMQALLVTADLMRSGGPEIHLCGHSLGGGMAAFCSVRTKLSASTINPAPLTASAGLDGLFGTNSQITNYIAGGSEFVSSSPGRNPGDDVAVPGTGNFFQRHSLVNTAPSVPLPRRM